MEKKKAKDFKDYNDYEEILNGYEPIFLNQDFISWNKDKYEGCRDSLVSYLIGYNYNFNQFFFSIIIFKKMLYIKFMVIKRWFFKITNIEFDNWR